MNHICLDGKILAGGQPVLDVDNKSYRYGDGLFETLKVYRGRILLANLHFNRFFAGLQTLQFELPHLLSAEKLQEQVLQLCGKNKCSELARVRLTAFRGNGGIYDGDNSLHYTIECWPLSPTLNQLNENGLLIDIYPLARKSCDAFANLKSANYLPYAMAARYAKANQLNDCLVLNNYERLADASIANLFLVKDRQLFTPPLSEGCVDGVMRKYLLENLPVTEIPLSASDLLTADEVFLSNAITGIRWVKQYREKQFTNDETAQIYQRLIKTFFD